MAIKKRREESQRFVLVIMTV